MKAISLYQPWASLCVTERASGPQLACDRCTMGVMDADNPHAWGLCECACHPPLGVYKTIETRSWAAPKSMIGERIAIHATKRKMRQDELGAVFGAEMPLWVLGVPVGAVVGTAVLVDCVPIHELLCDCPDRTPPQALPGITVADFGGAQTDYLSIGVGGLGREVLGLYGPSGLAYSRVNGNSDQHPWMANRDDEDVIAQIPFGHFECGRYGWLLDDVERFETPIPATGHQGIWGWQQPMSPPSSTVPPPHQQGVTP